jgi:hypothetical protein
MALMGDLNFITLFQNLVTAETKFIPIFAL